MKKQYALIVGLVVSLGPMSLQLRADGIVTELRYDPVRDLVLVIDTATNGLIAVVPGGMHSHVVSRPQDHSASIATNDVLIPGGPAESGGSSVVVIDFDTFPGGAFAPEGTVIAEQYLEVGAVFAIQDTLFPPGLLLIEDATDGVDFLSGLSLPNLLTFNVYTPGTAWGLGCNSDLRIDFVDTATQGPTAIRSADLQVFALGGSNTTLRLIGRDSGGAVVDQDEVVVSPSQIESFRLSVYAPDRSIASVETQGATGNDLCLGIDNLFIDFGSSDLAGSVTGMTPTSVTCRNLTTGQRVLIRGGGSAWSCEEAGLVVEPGDSVKMIVSGDAD